MQLNPLVLLIIYKNTYKYKETIGVQFKSYCTICKTEKYNRLEKVGH